ncbi:hypothetical protein Lal_00028305, partial [Lupinus albus]
MDAATTSHFQCVIPSVTGISIEKDDVTQAKGMKKKGGASRNMPFLHGCQVSIIVDPNLTQ